MGILNVEDASHYKGKTVSYSLEVLVWYEGKLSKSLTTVPISYVTKPEMR